MRENRVLINEQLRFDTVCKVIVPETHKYIIFYSDREALLSSCSIFQVWFGRTAITLRQNSHQQTVRPNGQISNRICRVATI